MSARSEYDAVIVGAGPNGLTAAAMIARAGHSVLVVEASQSVGGGARSADLTLPGFVHDVCSAIHPIGLASPAFRELGVTDTVDWVHPVSPAAHPLPDGRAAILERSLDDTVAQLGSDGDAYRKLFRPLVDAGLRVPDSLLSPLDIPPKHPLVLARYGLVGLRSAKALGNRFDDQLAPALLAGMAGHSMLRLDAPITGGFAMFLASLGHIVGWPMARGGSGAITDALEKVVTDAGGEIECGRRVTDLAELPRSRATLLDLTPRQVVAVAGARLPDRYRKALLRYRYGAGVFKVDWALDGPIPWTNEQARGAGTVHVGGTFEEVAESEAAIVAGREHDRPFVLVAQQSQFDDTRAPGQQQTAWGYCHVPHGSGRDMTDVIESQIERFAPGFRDRVLARHTMSSEAFEAYDANYVGGDINGGVADLRQFLARPVVSLQPWKTPVDGLYLCSSSTPPSGGVHGMCGTRTRRASRCDTRSGDTRSEDMARAMRLVVHDEATAAAGDAARAAARRLREVLAARDRARLVAATGASQLEFLELLVDEPGIAWSRVELFHLDEYVGLGEDHPASFARYMRQRLVVPAGIELAHLIDGTADPTTEVVAVGAALTGAAVDLLFAGIGENGHLAFNDPPADVTTDAPYLIVQLDEQCRAQQVGEGWFADVDDVPNRAISMSMRQVLRASAIIGVVTGERKAEAVARCFDGEISPDAPASYLRTHDAATIYLDRAAVSRLAPATLARYDL